MDFENRQDHSGKDLISDECESDDNAEEEDAMIPRALRKQAYSPKRGITEAVQGRLTVDAGKSHYINNQKARQVSLNFVKRSLNIYLGDIVATDLSRILLSMFLLSGYVSARHSISNVD